MSLEALCVIDLERPKFSFLQQQIARIATRTNIPPHPDGWKLCQLLCRFQLVKYKTMKGTRQMYSPIPMATLFFPATKHMNVNVDCHCTESQKGESKVEATPFISIWSRRLYDNAGATSSKHERKVQFCYYNQGCASVQTRTGPVTSRLVPV